MPEIKTHHKIKKFFETHPSGNRATRRNRAPFSLKREAMARMAMVQKLYKPEEVSLMQELKDTVTFDHKAFDHAK